MPTNLPHHASSGWRRWWPHFLAHARGARRCLKRGELQALEQQIEASEIRHLGELRICIESSLSPEGLWRGQTARQRAAELFSMLGVWDTEHNNGVLIYLLLAERRIEVLADRGLAHQPDAQAAFDNIVNTLLPDLQRDDFASALAKAIEQVGELLAKHYPAAHGERNDNELSNAIVLL